MIFANQTPQGLFLIIAISFSIAVVIANLVDILYKLFIKYYG